MVGDRVAIAERLLRLAGRVVAVGYLIGLVLLVPDMGDQARMTAMWWTPFAVAVVFGPGLAVGALSFHPDSVWMRRAAMLAAVGFPVANGAWLIAWRHLPLHADQWLADVPALAGLSAAVAWPAWASLLTLVVAAFTATVVNYTGRAPEVNVPFVPDLLYACGYSALFVAGLLMFVRTGRLLQTIQTDAFRGAASAAAMRGRADERARFAALTHDWVMSTLLTAARGGERDTVRRQALRTLNYLDDLEYPFGRVLDARDAAARLRAVINQIEPKLPVAIELAADAERWAFPAAAVSVTAAAAGEAVRNSLRHAGIGVYRHVGIRLGGGGFQVVVTDDGVGFDPVAERPDRLGITLSIRARMRQLGGGSAAITSRPGAGTTVRLRWSGPPIDRRAALDEYGGPTAKSAAPLSMRTLLGMRTPAARLLVGCYLVAYAASIATTPALISAPWPALACLLLTTAAMAAILATPGDPPSLGVSLAILGAGGPAQFAIVSAVDSMWHDTTVQEWSLGSAAVVCTFLCLRGRVVFSWLAMAFVFTEFAIRVGLPADGARGFTVPFLYLAPLVAATFFARVIRPVASTVLDLRADTLHRISAEAAEAAAIAERDRQLHRLGRLTRPLLEQLAGSESIDDVRDECALQEAELRDALRAPLLAHSPVVAAARAARGRGVQVLLYDEHGLDDVTEQVLQRLRTVAVAELDRARDGSVVVRIQRPGRRPLVTIVANGSDGTHRTELDQHARPLEQLLDTRSARAHP
ncbi:ATP-binding protein [Nocardia vaccinii]|uniref:ATP-binding protein n=1 Tax=Nocardia vaccinii TaxID=1822 RepID=UPI0008357E0A